MIEQQQQQQRRQQQQQQNPLCSGQLETLDFVHAAFSEHA